MKQSATLLASAVIAAGDFNITKCASCVDEVQKSGKYSEDAITPICNKHVNSSKCDFFSEALSLASSHPDFNGSSFCMHMEEAHFCSESMDRLLSSTPVSDLAYGECVRAEPKKTDRYCKKFQGMFSYAVKSEDLDTIRACYMIESYSNLTASDKDLEHVDAQTEQEPTPEKQQPKAEAPPRIIATSSKKLAPGGTGKASGQHTIPSASGQGKEDIVVKPEPFENFGAGKGHYGPRPAPPQVAPAPAPAKPAAPRQVVPAPAPAKAKAKAKGTIIVEPVPAQEAQLLAQPRQITRVQAAPQAQQLRSPVAQPAVAQPVAAQPVASQAATAQQEPSGLLTAVANSLTGAAPLLAAFTAPQVQPPPQAKAVAATSADHQSLIPQIRVASATKEVAAPGGGAGAGRSQLLATQPLLVQNARGKIVQSTNAVPPAAAPAKFAAGAVAVPQPRVAVASSASAIRTIVYQAHPKAAHSKEALAQAKKATVKTEAKVIKDKNAKDEKHSYFLSSFIGP